MNDLLFFAATGGLTNLQNDLISSWIGPAFFIVLAALSIKFIISRQFRELASFLAIAAVVGLMIFGGSSLFGKNGAFYKIANGFSKSISGDASTGSNDTNSSKNP